MGLCDRGVLRGDLEPGPVHGGEYQNTMDELVRMLRRLHVPQSMRIRLRAFFQQTKEVA